MTTMRTMMYRDDFDKNEMLDHAYELKKIACKMIEMLEGDDIAARKKHIAEEGYKYIDLTDVS